MKKQPVINPMLERSPEPFEEVWLYPEGWDLSEMERKPGSAKANEAENTPVEGLLFFRPVLRV